MKILKAEVTVTVEIGVEDDFDESDAEWRETLILDGMHARGDDITDVEIDYWTVMLK